MPGGYLVRLESNKLKSNKIKDNNMIRNIVFDYGGVLVDWNPRYLYDNYFSDTERSQWFIDNICTNDWNAPLDGGKPFDVGVAELTAKHPEWADALPPIVTAGLR